MTMLQAMLLAGSYLGVISPAYLDYSTGSTSKTRLDPLPSSHATGMLLKEERRLVFARLLDILRSQRPLKKT